MPPSLVFLKAPPRYVPGGREARDAFDRATYCAKSGPVLYTDTSPVKVFTVQAFTLIWHTIGEVVVAWTGTSPTNTVGDVASAARYMATTDFTIGTIGKYVKATPGPTPFEYIVDDSITVTIGGSGLATGQTRIWTFYVARSNNL